MFQYQPRRGGRGRRANGMGHTYTHLVVHIIFSTKGHQPSVGTEWKDDLYAYMGGIVREKRCTAIAVNGMPDYVHMLVGLTTDITLAELLRVVKTNSSKWVNAHRIYSGKFGWQEGYGVFSVSRSAMRDVELYIASQESPTRRSTIARSRSRKSSWLCCVAQA